MEWLTANIENIVAIATAVVTLASAIANITASDSDNKIVAFVSKFVDFLALNFRKS